MEEEKIPNFEQPLIEDKESKDEPSDQIETTKKKTKAKKTFLRNSFIKEYDKQNKEIEFRLHKDELLVQELNDDNNYEAVSFKDIIGASFDKIKTPQRVASMFALEEVYLFKLHLFPKIKKLNVCGCKTRAFGKRIQVDERFYCGSYDQVFQWRNLILHALHNTDFFKSVKELVVSNTSLSKTTIPEFKKYLLVFINPHSGTGQAARKWSIVEPILEKSGFEITKIETTHHKHCTEYILQAPSDELKKYHGLIAVSGDGLIHEIINGLYSRPDLEDLKDIAIGFIPGGTGNAHIKNMIIRTNELDNLETAAYFIAKGKTTKIDLTMIETEKKQRIVSFLSIVWAYPADVDLESEILRCCGDARFDLWGFWRLLALRRYRARFSYTTTLDLNTLPKIEDSISGDTWKNLDDEFCFFAMNNGPYLSGQYYSSPQGSYSDGYNYALIAKGRSNSRWNMLKFLVKTQKGEHILKNGEFNPGFRFDYEKMKAFRLEPYGQRKGIFSIDGEQYEAQKIQAWVHEKALNIFVTK